MFLSSDMPGRILDSETVRVVQRVFARIQSEGRLSKSQDVQEGFAAYLLKMYIRGLVIEEKLYGLGVVAAREKFQDAIEVAKDPSLADFALRRVLIVEDDFYLASEIQRMFEEAGAVVLGPIGSREDALSVLGSEVPDLAIIDLNLGSGPDFGIAEHLFGQSVPFCVVTGYRRGEIGNVPSALDNVPWLEKPVGRQAVLQWAIRVTGGRTTPHMPQSD